MKDNNKKNSTLTRSALLYRSMTIQKLVLISQVYLQLTKHQNGISITGVTQPLKSSLSIILIRMMVRQNYTCRPTEMILYNSLGIKPIDLYSVFLMVVLAIYMSLAFYLNAFVLHDTISKHICYDVMALDMT